MSHHSQLSPESIQKLKAQRRNSTISAIIIALLVSSLLVTILYFISISSLFKNEEELVSYSPGSETVDTITKPEVTNEVQKKPSSPSSSVTKVIAASTPSAIAIPLSTEVFTEPSLDFGNGSDFGDGWGGSGSGDGNSGGGGASFFKQEVKAERIAYVIDYSASMNSDGKLNLMKAELSKSVASLPDSVEYSLIFFAGPAWLAGDKVTRVTDPNGGPDKNRTFIVNSGGKKYEWSTTGGAHHYKPENERKLQKAEWLTSKEGQRKQSLKLIENTKTVYGTVWQYSLEMAIEMDPKPDIIFFMTDGSAGAESATVAKEIGRKARRKGIIVNTIALKEPRAREPMSKLAKTTGGIFTMVEADGSIKQADK